jgi:hypothetical protein
MEKIEILINNEDQVSEESKKLINQMIDHVSKIIEETIDEGQTITENQIGEENIETNDDAVIPSTTSEPSEEQENFTDINTTASASGLSSRTNVPFKEVNNRKREFDNEDEQAQENILDNNERTGDQTKKIKIVEPTDSPKVPENNIIVNSTFAVEV